MIMAHRTFEQDKVNLGAKKFLVWLFIVSSFIFFAGLTSGYIVYTAGDPSRGLKMILPDTFIYSTVVIGLSSLTMHLAYLAGKRLQYDKQKLFIVATIILSLLFFVLQVSTWKTFVAQGIYFVNPNASLSFVYIFIGAHLVHIFAGILMLVNVYIGRMKNIPQVLNMFRLETTSIFWHFIDILWIYLYVFLLLNQ
jgi:cytochrome c oxidase subunit III